MQKKGFTSSSVLEKALRTRRENRLARMRMREEDRGRLEIIEDAIGYNPVRVKPKTKKG